MFLSVFFKGEWRHAETSDETSRLVAEVVEGLQGEKEDAGSWYPGEDAWFCIANRRHTETDPGGGSNLRVAINRRYEYGALVWFVDEGFPEEGEVHNSVWISDNPEPLDFDPRVVSDPGYPLFHDPASTLPLSRIQAAVAEFCCLRTGNRPECINWVAGHMNGQRLDRPAMVEVVEDPEIDWDSLR